MLDSKVFLKKFVAKVVFYRLSLGLSQSVLARLCGVSAGTIGNLESLRTAPSFGLICKLSDVFNIKIFDLFDFDD